MDPGRVMESTPTVTGHVCSTVLGYGVMKALSLGSSASEYTTPICPRVKRQIPVEGELRNMWLLPLTTLEVSGKQGRSEELSQPQGASGHVTMWDPEGHPGTGRTQEI